MAKAKNLAILAGLAGLAYANRDKLFGGKGKDKDKSESSGMTPAQNDELATVNRISKMSDDSDTLARVNREESSGLPKTKSDVVSALTAPKAAPNDKAPNQGVVPPKSSGKSAAKAVAPTPSDRRTSESGMSRGTRPAVAKNPDYSNEGRSSTAPTSTPVATTTKISDVPKSTANKFEHEMPISRFFKNVREAGNRGNPDVKMASGGMTASRRGDGIASRGKTRGKIC